MVELKELTPENFELIAAQTGFDRNLLAKDYILTRILFLIKDIKGIYFKGGTALAKTVLDHSRLSEDIDFTTTRDVKDIEKEIENILKSHRWIISITRDKNVDGFIRMVIHFKSMTTKDDSIYIDLNKKAKLLIPTELKNISHFYKGILPEFSFPCLAQSELVAEKVAAAIGRNKPRDHYDIYQIIKRKIHIDMALVNEKCRQSGDETNIIRMFNKAKRLKNRWDEDLAQILIEDVTFKEIMSTLTKHFNLKEEKEKIKKKRLH